MNDSSGCWEGLDGSRWAEETMGPWGVSSSFKLTHSSLSTLLFLCLLTEIWLPLDLLQHEAHSFPWLAVSSWKLSNWSRCSSSHTYFLTQAFITASHPKLRRIYWEIHNHYSTNKSYLGCSGGFPNSNFQWI